LKYRVQNNVFEWRNKKKYKNESFLKYFDVRFRKTHGKGICLPCARTKCTAKVCVCRVLEGNTRQRERLCRAPSHDDARQRLMAVYRHGGGRKKKLVCPSKK
jgi:hypothetical protein